MVIIAYQNPGFSLYQVVLICSVTRVLYTHTLLYSRVNKYSPNSVEIWIGPNSSLQNRLIRWRLPSDGGLNPPPQSQHKATEIHPFTANTRPRGGPQLRRNFQHSSPCFKMLPDKERFYPFPFLSSPPTKTITDSKLESLSVSHPSTSTNTSPCAHNCTCKMPLSIFLDILISSC